MFYYKTSREVKMSFQTIAQEIIDDSIKSALYIDDKIAIPFEDDRTNPNYQFCSQVFHSFDRNNTNIKFYRYKNPEELEKQETRLFQSRDLLILDWKLKDQYPRFLNSLHILKQAVQIDNIFSIVIYTDSLERELSDIYHNICCYFSNLTLDSSHIEYQIIEKLDEMGIDPKFIRDTLGDLKSLAIHPNHAVETFKELRASYKNILLENFNNFETFLKALFENKKLPEVYKLMGYAFNKCVFPSLSLKSIEIEINDKNNEPYFLINNTFIFIESKTKIDPENLYPKIKDAIIGSSNNFLPIMGMEMRNAFNNSSAIISKKLSSIDEYAFLHHQNKINPQESFFEFLKELWKDQSFHFLLYDDMLRIFTKLSSYRKERGITKKSIWEKIKKGDLDNDLGRLNCFYNLVVDTQKSRCIGFGDIFSLKVDNANTNKYILCITAHCDCLYPEKLKNNFYFIEGTEYKLPKGLKEGDTGFNSFIEGVNNEKIICIKWKDKPITIYIPNESNNITSDISIIIGTNNYSSKYEATLKENYAQRMANRSFSYPLHVGIFFADKKKK